MKLVLIKKKNQRPGEIQLTITWKVIFTVIYTAIRLNTIIPHTTSHTTKP